MTCVIVASRSRTFFDGLCGIIGPGFSPVQIFDGTLYHQGDKSDLLITQCQFEKGICTDRQIVVYREPLPVQLTETGNGKAVAVVDSCRPELLEYVSSTGLLAITCGLSARDTVTLSSIGSDHAVINLQRSIECFDGTVAEPQELPVRFGSPIDSYQLMAAASIYILGGKIDRLVGAEFLPNPEAVADAANL